MVGATCDEFTREGVSRAYASGLLDKNYNTAERLDYSDYFCYYG
jgi:hypothetical protein